MIKQTTVYECIFGTDYTEYGKEKKNVCSCCQVVECLFAGEVQEYIDETRKLGPLQYFKLFASTNAVHENIKSFKKCTVFHLLLISNDTY